MARGPLTKMLLVYVGSGEDLISQKCEYMNKVRKADTTWATRQRHYRAQTESLNATAGSCFDLAGSRSKLNRTITCNQRQRQLYCTC